MPVKAPPLIMVPLLVIPPELVRVPPFTNITFESICSPSPALRVRLVIVQVLVPEFQVPPIASHAPLESPTCNS